MFGIIICKQIFDYIRFVMDCITYVIKLHNLDLFIILYSNKYAIISYLIFIPLLFFYIKHHIILKLNIEYKIQPLSLIFNLKFIFVKIYIQ